MGTDRTRSLVVPAWLSDPGLLCLTRGYSRISIAHRLPLLVPRDHLAAAQKPVRAHPWLSQLDLVSTELTNRTSIFQTNTENKRKCVEAGTGTHLNVGPGFGGVQDLQRNAISLQLCPELLVAVQAVRARATRGVLLTLQVSCEHQHHPQPPAVISIAVGQYDDNDMRILQPRAKKRHEQDSAGACWGTDLHLGLSVAGDDARGGESLEGREGGVEEGDEGVEDGAYDARAAGASERNHRLHLRVKHQRRRHRRPRPLPACRRTRGDVRPQAQDRREAGKRTCVCGWCWCVRCFVRCCSRAAGETWSAKPRP
eukprot:1445031-Rhodomonas_salina.2